MTHARSPLIASLLLLALGCGGGGSDPGTAQPTVLLKDAPGDVQAAFSILYASPRGLLRE